MTTEPPIPSEPVRPLAPGAMTGWVTLGDSRVVELASPGARLGARVIDFIILAIGLAVLIPLGIGGSMAIVGGGTDAAAGLGVASLFGTVLLVAVLGVVYEVVLVALRGQTVGKMATNTKVIRADTGDLPGWSKSIGRWAIPYLAGLVPLIGWLVTLLTYLSLTWDDRRQGWHDKAAGTVVVKA